MLIQRLALPALLACCVAAPAHAADCGKLCSSTWMPYASASEAEQRIAMGDDINGQNRDGDSPLIVAVGAGKQDIAKILLDRGAAVNATNRDGLSALHLAIGLRGGDRSMVRLLLDRGADPNQRYMSGLTPLHMVARASNDSGLIRLLRERGADARLGDGQNLTPIHYLVLAKRSTKPMIRGFVDAGVDINAKDRETGFTALHQAASQSADPVVLMHLIEAGADVNATDTLGATPLHIAAIQGTSFRNIELLVERGADIQARTSKGLTALQLARHNPALQQYFRQK